MLTVLPNYGQHGLLRRTNQQELSRVPELLLTPLSLRHAEDGLLMIIVQSIIGRLSLKHQMLQRDQSCVQIWEMFWTLTSPASAFVAERKHVWKFSKSWTSPKGSAPEHRASKNYQIPRAQGGSRSLLYTNTTTYNHNIQGKTVSTIQKQFHAYEFPMVFAKIAKKQKKW